MDVQPNSRKMELWTVRAIDGARYSCCDRQEALIVWRALAASSRLQGRVFLEPVLTEMDGPIWCASCGQRLDGAGQARWDLTALYAPAVCCALSTLDVQGGGSGEIGDELVAWLGETWAASAGEMNPLVLVRRACAEFDIG